MYETAGEFSWDSWFIIPIFDMKALVLIFTLVSTSAFAESESSFPDMLDGDPREVRSASSPSWLAAVGRTVSTTSTTYTFQEQCTLSIVADAPGKDGIIAVTAGHCVDHWRIDGGLYEVGHNTVAFKTNDGRTIVRSISEVFKTEMNPADYAIVKLNAPIKNSDIKPLINSPFAHSRLLNHERFARISKPYATVAGFSADKGLGKKGQVLTYHEKCRLGGGMTGAKLAYCYSYTGASGGPVVVTVDLEGYILKAFNLSGGTQHLFVGSISGKRRGTDNSKVLFTDTSHYADALDKILAAH